MDDSSDAGSSEPGDWRRRGGVVAKALPWGDDDTWTQASLPSPRGEGDTPEPGAGQDSREREGEATDEQAGDIVVEYF